MSGIPFPPKPWVDGQTFEYEQDGTTVTGKYNASSNAWTFTRSYPGASTGQITTATVLAMNERPPALAVSPFSDAYQGTETQQDVNWFLFDDIENTVRYSNDEPSADNFVNRFWWDSNTEVLYVWDGGQWQLSSPNAASQNVTRGITIDASGGQVNESGNIVIKNDPDTPDSGRLYISDANNDSRFTIFSSGSVETKNSLSFAGTNTNKNIRAYGVTNPNLRFMVGPNSDNLFELMTIDSNIVSVKGLLKAEKSSTFTGAMTAQSTLDVAGLSTLSGGLVVDESSIIRKNLSVYENTSITGTLSVTGSIASTITLDQEDALIFDRGAQQTITLAENTSVKIQPTVYGGGAQGNPTNGSFTLGVRDTSQAYLTPPYKIDFDTGYETIIDSPKISRMFLNNGSFYFYKGANSSSPASNILTIFNRNGNAMEAWGPIRSSVYTGDQPGITISAEKNTSSTWNSAKAGQLAFQTWTDNANSNGGKVGVVVSGGHSSPDFMFAFQPNNVTQYRVFSNSYSPAYGKRMYIYPDYTNPNVPDDTPVTIGYLKQNGLITTATFSSTAGAPDDEGNPSTVLTQSSVSIPAQLELDGRTDSGRGFTLQGKTQSQPDNSSAILLTVQHSSGSVPAEVEYFGSTGATGDCIQTATSVNAAINTATAALPVLPTNWDFYNSQTPNTNSTLAGSWVMQWAYNSTTAIMIIKATNGTEGGNISSGTVVSNIPSTAMPPSTVVIPLASRDGETTASAVVSPTNGYIYIRNVQGSGNTRLEGQLVYSLHSA